MAKNIKQMINRVGEGDLSGAQDAFDTAVMARRESEIANYKTMIAQNSFQPPEPHPGQDTGITGEPGEVDELTLTNPFKKKKTPEQRGALGSQPGYKLGKRTDHDETPSN